MKKTIFSACLIMLCIPQLWAQKAVVTESQASMTTYGFGDPNPVANPLASFYPYWRFDQFDSKGVEKTWKTVTLENDYIRVTLFPEIGGKVWGAVDKTTGKEFVYYNHVVKFRDIAMRGAWVSGGIEFNFGIIGHVPTSATPVDYCTLTKPDGSVSCHIASYELITRTQWNIEINLPADKAYFTTSVVWQNASPLEQPYYQWMNAAFKSDGNLQLCYPGNAYIGHDGVSHPYPDDGEGRDLSWFSANAFGHDKSYHILGEYAGYYGAYWHDDNFGFAHCSRPDEKLGRKFFCWSQAREGEIWKDLLTDNDGQYVEMQAGRMFNQPGTNSMDTPFKHHTFTPMGTDCWTEYWYPVENIGAYSEASPLGALTLKRKGDTAQLLLSPVVAGEKKLEVYADGQLIHAEVIRLEPLKVCRTDLQTLPNGKYLRVIVGDNELVYDENPASRQYDRPLMMPADFDWNTAYGHYVRGEQYLNIRHFADAERELSASLAIDKHYAPALVKMALLKLQLGCYKEAQQHARGALALNTYDAEANYLWGMANLRLGNITDAKDGFALATYSAALRSAAYAMLAKLALREHNMREAGIFIAKALEANPKNMDALQSRLVCYRLSGQSEAFGTLAGQLLDVTPLNQIVRFELLLAGRLSSDEFMSALRCEMPEQELLEMASWYIEEGCTADAATLCGLTSYPLALYLKAYLLRDSDATSSRAALKAACEASPAQVFPFRQELMHVLDWAKENDASKSWKTDYYRALLCWNRGEENEALALLNSCEPDDFAPLYVSRASLKQGEGRLSDLMKAQKAGDSWHVGNALVAYYSAAKEWDKACGTAESYFKRYPDKFAIGLSYANALCESGQYTKCIKVLNRFKVMPNEGARTGHTIYRRANLRLAKQYLKAKNYAGALKAVEASKIWNENLGVGKPYEDTIDYTIENQLVDAARNKAWQRADEIEIK